MAGPATQVARKVEYSTGPLERYLAPVRTSGRSEGAARDALEEEKRRRYARHTLLGQVLGGEIGDWALGDSGPAGDVLRRASGY